MKIYEVKIGGIVHTVQLTDEDAKAQGLTAPEPASKAGKAPANKSKD